MKNGKLLTIISASNRPHHMQGFLENLQQTLQDPSCIELLVKIDDGDAVMQTLLAEAVEKYPFEIRYIQTPRLDGYYTLHYGYQQLFEMSNKETYFIFPVNEEVRFKTQGWDAVLAKYIKFFEDDLFRLKISRLKYRNYYSIHDCGPTPENYPFLTRKWVELAGGIGDCWGPDGWHQYIDFHLGQTEGLNGIPGLFRSVPIHDILIGGEEAGKELSPQQSRIRSHRIFQEWWRMYSTPVQQEFRRIATRMYVYSWARNEGFNDFEIIENTKIKKFNVKDASKDQLSRDFYYHLSPHYIRFENFRFLLKMARCNSVGFLTAFIFPSYGPEKRWQKTLDYLSRYFIVIIAVLLSLISSGSASLPKQIHRRVIIRSRSMIQLASKGVVHIAHNRFKYYFSKLNSLKLWIQKVLNRFYFTNPLK